MKHDFEFFKNKPNSDSLILDGFGQSKGLDRFSGWQGTRWNAQNCLKQAGTKDASCL